MKNIINKIILFFTPKCRECNSTDIIKTEIMIGVPESTTVKCKNCGCSYNDFELIS
jgi:transcription elongation factor Elf1